VSRMEKAALKELASDSIQIVISEDGNAAFLHLVKSDSWPALSQDKLSSLLKKHGIIFGLRNERTTISEDMTAQGDIIIAEGRKPVDGKDGWIEWSFNSSKKVDDGGKVDHRNLGLIHNVLQSQSLAIIHSPKAGVEGMTVRGEAIAPKQGKVAEVKLGKNVTLDPADATKIIALADGNASVKPDGTIEVDTVLTIEGNVDYSSGDIDFVGDVVILGDVKSGFTVKSCKSIDVHGNVEDATIEAGGDVTIRNGLIGQGKGVMRAGGSVRAQHIVNHTIIAGKNIVVEREAMSAKLSASGKILSPNAVFVGCTLQAGDELDVRNLGNSDQTQAKVRVGKRGILLDQLSALDRDCSKIQKQISDVKNAIYGLVRTQLDNGKLTPDQVQLLGKLKSAQIELAKTAERQEVEKGELRTKLQENSLAKVVVRDTMFSNVFIELNGVKKVVQHAVREVVLTETSGTIEEKSLE
jgi:uncharacterized protein (DUF342 family)